MIAHRIAPKDCSAGGDFRSPQFGEVISLPIRRAN
jgi:hypothetical protein